MAALEIRRYLPLVRSVASRIATRLPRHVEIDDLVGAGVLGLLNAERQFDSRKGVPFDRYAEIRIRGAILDELRSLDPTTRTTRRQSGEIAEMIRSLNETLGRSPSSAEVAAAMGIPERRYDEMVTRLSPVIVLGFDDLGLGRDDERRDALQYLRDPDARDPESETHLREIAVRLAQAVEKLTDRQRQVVTFYYFEGMNFHEIAEFIGVTEGRISQLHTAAMARLRNLLKDQQLA